MSDMASRNRPPRTREGLPADYTPRVAGYARGPLIEPSPEIEVLPSEWRWRNARTVNVKALDGHDYRCIPIHSGDRFLGYWAVEFLGVPLPLAEWE